MGGVKSRLYRTDTGPFVAWPSHAYHGSARVWDVCPRGSIESIGKAERRYHLDRRVKPDGSRSIGRATDGHWCWVTSPDTGPVCHVSLGEAVVALVARGGTA